MGQAWPHTQRPFSYLPRIFDLTPGTGDNSSQSRRDAPRARGQWAGFANRDKPSAQPPSVALTARTAEAAPGSLPRQEDTVSREWPGRAPGGDPPAHLRTSGGQEEDFRFYPSKIRHIKGL